MGSSIWRLRTLLTMLSPFCWGTGTAHFRLSLRLRDGNNSFRTGGGDFNADGKLDLAVANFDENTVTILLGNGDGTFAPAFASSDGRPRTRGGRLQCDGNWTWR